MITNSPRFWIGIAGISGIVAVSAGAYGYHALKDDAAIQDAFGIAVQYHMWHTLALFAVSWLLANREDRSAYWAERAGWFFLAGILMFSGSLYAYCLTGENPTPAMTPIGGGMFIAGWGMLAWSAMRNTSSR